ncbi:hypothetical protein TNCT_211101 [Trichonephila clavata]|uniref:Uncharacterized protein n=1 Tax=Trichonephila clavata TaxID=2740835 RepID=A0A8X6IZF3_TRICU|nr:hypothetical protein TNCT_211101 [Trichonephila clavata]
MDLIQENLNFHQNNFDLVTNHKTVDLPGKECDGHSRYIILRLYLRKQYDREVIHLLCLKEDITAIGKYSKTNDSFKFVEVTVVQLLWFVRFIIVAYFLRF